MKFRYNNQLNPGHVPPSKQAYNLWVRATDSQKDSKEWAESEIFSLLGNPDELDKFYTLLKVNNYANPR